MSKSRTSKKYRIEGIIFIEIQNLTTACKQINFYNTKNRWLLDGDSETLQVLCRFPCKAFTDFGARELAALTSPRVIKQKPQWHNMDRTFTVFLHNHEIEKIELFCASIPLLYYFRNCHFIFQIANSKFFL